MKISCWSLRGAFSQVNCCAGTRQESKNSATEYHSKVMAKEAENQKTKMTFMKAYGFLLERADLSSAEKLALIVVCRYWPNPYWDSNAEISRTLGCTERYIEKVVKSLADKGIIKRGYAHITINGKPHTVRVIAPLCFPKTSCCKINWVKPERMDGEQTEHMDGNCPNNSQLAPERSDDLLEKSRGINRKATPAPLPAEGQAPALLRHRTEEEQAQIERFKKKHGVGGWQRTPQLTPEQKEQRKQEQIKELLAGQAVKDRAGGRPEKNS